MEHRKLGSSDLHPSVIGIGGYPFGPPLADQAMTTRVLDQARESGVNYIDTSDIYAQGQSEVQIGVAIEGHRDDFILATKFNLSNLGDETPRQRIMRKIDESLTKLKTDHIELYQIHHVAKDIPAEEILQPLDELVKAGKIRYVGNCNYSSWRQMEAMQVARDNNLSWFVSTQNHYNMIFRHVELEILPFCNAYETGFIPYFPLAGGFLTGQYRPGQAAPAGTRSDLVPTGIVNKITTDRSNNLLLKLESFAQERDHTVAELALSWLLSHPEVTTIINGAEKPEYIAANAKAADWVLTPEEMVEVDAITSWWDGDGAAVDTTGGTTGAGSGVPRA
jgi:aryl-alcohol dehydrogenase-like predicted oxidoreductase